MVSGEEGATVKFTAMSGKNSAARVKDVLTEHISRDIKAVGDACLGMSTFWGLHTSQVVCEMCTRHMHNFSVSQPLHMHSFFTTRVHTQLQSHYSDMSAVVDMVTSSNSHAQALCEHLDHVLLHG